MFFLECLPIKALEAKAPDLLRDSHAPFAHWAIFITGSDLPSDVLKQTWTNGISQTPSFIRKIFNQERMDCTDFGKGAEGIGTL